MAIAPRRARSAAEKTKYLHERQMSSQNLKLKIVFAGGGTGGHLYPAIAIADELCRRCPQSEIHFIGTARGIETQVIPKLGYHLHLIAVRGVQRGRLWANIWVPVRLLWSFFQSMFILLKLRPAVVVGTGGYVSGPMLFMAAVLGIPTIIQEQNSFPGVTTRLLAKWVHAVHLTYEASRKYFKDQSKVAVTGNPVRSFQHLALSKADARLKFGLKPDKFTVFVFGGSQGARGINKVMTEMAPKLLALRTIQLLWSAGPQGILQAQTVCREKTELCAAHEFIHDMAAAYAACDLVICRAGATTLAEIAICGLPAILIPFPFAAAGHQETNARTLAELQAAEVILESELTGELLLDRVLFYFQNNNARQVLRENILRAARPNATSDLASAILALAKINEQEQ